MGNVNDESEMVGPCIDVLCATYYVISRLQVLRKTENSYCSATRYSKSEPAKHGMLRCSCNRAQNDCVRVH